MKGAEEIRILLDAADARIARGNWQSEAHREAWEDWAAHLRAELTPDIPTLTPITARPVDLNPEAWGEDASGEDDLADAREETTERANVGGCCMPDRCLCPHVDHDSSECFDREMAEAWAEEAEDDDAPRCYVKGCGETENLEPCFVGEYVCPECKASQQHQREVAGELALEGGGL